MRCQPTQRRMRPEAIVPGGVGVQALLNRLSVGNDQGHPPPPLHAPEESLNLGVELPSLSTPASMFDPSSPKFVSEALLELTASIGHEVSRPTRGPRYLVNQCHHLWCGRAGLEQLDRDDLPAEAIEDRGDLEPQPQNPQHRQVQVPDMIGAGRLEEVLRGPSPFGLTRGAAD